MAFVDDFNRADGAVGNGWTVAAGGFLVESNRLKSTAAGRIVRDLGDADGWFYVEEPVTEAAAWSLVLRFIDNSNYVMVRRSTVGNIQILERIAGVNGGAIINVAGRTPPIVARLEGLSLRVYSMLGGVLTETGVASPYTINAIFAGVTTHGIDMQSAGGTLRLDHYRHTGISLSAAAGASTTSGNAAALVDRVAAAAGASTTTGNAAAAIVRSAVAAGASVTAGDANAVRLMPITATGASVTTGAATAALVRTAAATGASITAGNAAALLDRLISAAGASTTAGAAAAFVDRRAAASGASTTAGAAAGVIAHTVSASGASTTSGAVAGAIVRSVTATGSSTTAGAAAALLLLVIVPSGASTTAGTANVNLALVIAASGASTTSGAVAALLRLMASASGASTTSGSAGSVLPRRAAIVITDVLDVRVGQVQTSFVFTLVDALGDVIGRLTPLRPAGLDHSTNRRIYRRLDDLLIPPSEQAAVNVLTDRVRVGMVIAGVARGELGHEDTPLPWGEYVFDDRPREIESWGELWHGSLLDVTALLDDGLPTGVTYPTGFSVATALAEQFDAALFNRYDIEVPDYLTFGTPISATVGTPRIEFMRQMAALGACGLWMANTGRGRVARIPVGDAVDPTLNYVSGRNIVRSSILVNDSRLRAPNRWVVNDTAANPPVVGIFDLPASAENSQQNRGRIITAPPRPVQGIPGSTAAEKQVNANAMAKADSVHDARAAQTATCDGAVDPRHDTFDYVGLLGQVYVEHAWATKLETGADMSHDLRLTYA